MHVNRVGESADTKALQSANASSAPGPQPVDINRADANLLRSLPGIGSARADNIIASRQKDGPFRATEDLIQRKLLTQGIYDQVKGLIEVAP